MKIFEKVMLIRSQATTLLQIFCELLLYSQNTFKSMILSNGTLSVNGLICVSECGLSRCELFKNNKKWLGGP